MHLPRKRNIERSGIFFRLNGHHLLNYRLHGQNFQRGVAAGRFCFWYAAAAPQNPF